MSCPGNLMTKQAYEKFVLEGVSEKHKQKYHVVEDQRFLGKKDLARKCVRLALPCSFMLRVTNCGVGKIRNSNFYFSDSVSLW